MGAVKITRDPYSWREGAQWGPGIRGPLSGLLGRRFKATVHAKPLPVDLITWTWRGVEYTGQAWAQAAGGGMFYAATDGTWWLHHWGRIEPWKDPRP